MAPRNFWKGYLKLSLVTCPVQMMPAISDAQKVKFHTLNRKTQNRIAAVYVDAVTGKPVEEDQQVKGYEKGEDEYVMLEDDELDAVTLESTRTIDIDTFVATESMEWIYYDKPHYLMPDGEVGEEAFAVIREAMARTKTVGLSRLVMYRRERAIMLQPRGKGIILWTLRYGDEVRDPKRYFSNVEEMKPDKKLVALVHQLIEDKSKPWSPNMVDDPIQDKLLDLVAQKKKGKKIIARSKEEAEQDEGSNVVSIMDALKASIAAGKRRKS